MFKPIYGYQDIQPLYEEIAQGILKLNSEMLSEYEVHEKLRFDFLVEQTTEWTEPSHLHNKQLLDLATKFITHLAEFEQWQDIDIPIMHLWHDEKPIKIGRVTFYNIFKEEIEKWKKEGHCPSSIDEVKVIARVNAPGDRQKALTYAKNEVSLTLNYIRALCFPFGKKSDMWPVGILGDFDASKLIPVRINNRGNTTLVGPGVYTNRLATDILAMLTQKQIDLINTMILKQNYSEMEIKLRDSIHWLAEATKPDTDKVKFIKICLALETMLGSESDIEILKAQGIIVMLAERAAFIAGKGFADIMHIDEKIHEYYGIRSKIIHGRKIELKDSDIEEFGILVRKIALSLLERLAVYKQRIKNVNDLARWIKELKYKYVRN